MLEKRRLERNALGFSFLLVLVGFVLVYFSFVHRSQFISMPPTAPFPDLIYGFLFIVILFAAEIILRNTLPHADPLLLPLVAFLCGIGLVFLYRLAPDLALVHKDPGLRWLAVKQLIWMIIGLAGMLGVGKYLNDERLISIARKKYLYVILSICLIVATIFFAEDIRGRRLWLDFGLFRVQTVEIVKIVLVFFIAGYFTDEGLYIRSRKILGFQLPELRYTGPFFLMAFLAILPIFIQKDLGPTVLLFFLFLAMFLVGSSIRSFVIFGLVILILGGYLAYHYNFPSMVRTRMDMWFHPFSYSENMARSFWALSSGRLWGVGMGMGQPQYIPEVHSDFNFVGICEELGFIGGIAILVAYFLILARGFKIAIECEDTYQKLLATGLMAMFAIQSLMIVGGVTGAIPLTGITLPFISYGGSSMVINFVLLGILLRISNNIGLTEKADHFRQAEANK